MDRLYILYDGRAKVGDVDDAAVYVIAASEAEAIEDSKDASWQDGIWYEYEIHGDKLLNGKPRPDILKEV